MIAGWIYCALAVFAMFKTGSQIPNEALMYLLICNLWFISAGAK